MVVVSSFEEKNVHFYTFENSSMNHFKTYSNSLSGAVFSKEMQYLLVSTLNFTELYDNSERGLTLKQTLFVQKDEGFEIYSNAIGSNKIIALGGKGKIYVYRNSEDENGDNSTD